MPKLRRRSESNARLDEDTSISPQALTDLVLERLRRPKTATAKARRIGLSPSTLEAATERFVNAGADALTQNLAGARWIGFGLELPDQLDSAAWDTPSFLAALYRVVRRWLREGCFTGFFFMIKPPGLRLRFQASDPESFESRARGWFRRQGVAAYAHAQIYEPEEHQFGGAKGTEIAHRFFTADSLAALAFKTDAGRGQTRITGEWLSLYCLMPVLREIASDRFELWEAPKKPLSLLIRRLRAADAKNNFPTAPRNFVAERIQLGHELESNQPSAPV